jgi:hypothetical protein
VNEFAWLEDDDASGPTRSTRPRLLVALATVPWLVVVLLLVAPGRYVDGASPGEPTVHAPVAPPRPAPGGSAAAAGASNPDPVASTPDASPPGANAPAGWREGPSGDADDDLLAFAELRGRWRVEAGPEEAAALAVVIARAWLTGLDPQLAIDGIRTPPGGYAEHLVVESVEQPAREAAVVTLLAVLLDGDDGLEAGVRRLAVPIAWERDGPRPAGPPWWLPGPALEPLVPERTAMEAPEDLLAALEALDAAGFDVELRSLWGTSGWPVIAEVAGRTRDGHPVAGPLWLRRHLGGFVVAGTTLAGPDTRPPAHAGEQVGP